MSENFIRDYWDGNSSKEGHNASWGDNWCVQLEIDNIAQYIKDADKVLDVGCANGFAVLEQSKRHNIDIRGIDFSEEMIKSAQSKFGQDKNPYFIFDCGDVRKLPFKDEQFDVTYTTRCLINLPTWEEQIEGIKECIRVTKTGGTIILSEAFYEPLQRLNALRLICGLAPLVEHDFNRYIKKGYLYNFIKSLHVTRRDSNPKIFEIESFECVDFSSVYYLGSRFLRDLVTDINQFEGYSNPINKAFYELEKEYSGGGFGIQQSYVIKK